MFPWGPPWSGPSLLLWTGMSSPCRKDALPLAALSMLIKHPNLPGPPSSSGAASSQDLFSIHWGFTGADGCPSECPVSAEWHVRFEQSLGASSPPGLWAPLVSTAYPHQHS